MTAIDLAVCEWSPGSNRSTVDPVVAVARLRELVKYDPDTGFFTRLTDSTRRRHGDRAETFTSKGYVTVFAGGQLFTAARLAMLFVNGVWPCGMVVSRNGDLRDLRFCNLIERPVGHQVTARNSLTQARLKELFCYEVATGVFTRSEAITRHRGKAGEVAGNLTQHGYLTICVGYRDYYAHRLAWLWVHGEWPSKNIDHIDGDGANNRIANLRDVPQLVNCQNLRAAPKHSTSGILGTSFIKKTGRWRSRIVVNKVPKELGLFNSPTEAHAAYVHAKRQFHEGNTL